MGFAARSAAAQTTRKMKTTRDTTTTTTTTKPRRCHDEDEDEDGDNLRVGSPRFVARAPSLYIGLHRPGWPPTEYQFEGSMLLVHDRRIRIGILRTRCHRAKKPHGVERFASLPFLATLLHRIAMA